MLLVFFSVCGFLEVALVIIDDFSILSGCKINWKKRKIICIWMNEISVYFRYIDRITGDDFYVYFGLLYMEGEENSEVGRRICI